MSLSNIDIAQAARMLPITAVAERLGIPEESLEPYGRYKAKISLDYLAPIRDRPPGKLVLVTAVSPTSLSVVSRPIERMVLPLVMVASIQRAWPRLNPI